MKQLSATGAGAKALRRISARDRARIDAALDLYAATGRGDVVALAGTPGLARLRVGKFRVIFTESETAVIVQDAGSRGDIYKR